METNSNISQYYSPEFYLSVLLGAVIILIAIRKAKFLSGTPPGPWGVPVLGYAPFLSKEPYKDFQQISKKYGDVFSLQLGSRYVIVLNSCDVIKKAFKLSAFDGRQQGKDTELFDNGIIVAEGEIWRKQRRFLQSAMRDFGVGTSRMESFVENEVLTAVEVLKSTNGQPYNIAPIIENIACNVIAYFIFGQRFSVDNEPLKKALNDISKAVEEVNFMAAYASFPEILQYVPDSLSGLKLLTTLKTKIYNFVDKLINDHKKSFNDNDIRDLIDVYLKQIKGNQNIDDMFNDNLLRQNTMNMFIAGTHTTNNLINWAIQVLAAHPTIQKQMQKELDDVIGRERLPLLKDKQNLPYTEAVLLEIYRYVTLVPVTLYHRVTENINFEGYQIPQNSCALANIWNAHHSTEIWTNPDKFEPQRFLNSNGKLIPERVENVIPFSTGRRNCAGESIARMEVFLITTTLFQKFSFKLPKGEVWKFQPRSFVPTISCTHENFVCATAR